MKKFITKLFNIDSDIAILEAEVLALTFKINLLETSNLEKDEKLKSLQAEKGELRKALFDVDKEIASQIKEFSNKCIHTDENLAKHYPYGLDSVSKSELYNNANNTERLIYLQKLDNIKGLIKK
jgi:hypothetical protein